MLLRLLFRQARLPLIPFQRVRVFFGKKKNKKKKLKNIPRTQFESKPVSFAWLRRLRNKANKKLFQRVSRLTHSYSLTATGERNFITQSLTVFYTYSSILVHQVKRMSIGVSS